MTAPRVSICIATFNKSIRLYRTLRSIREQQPDFDYELIVVDDGSSDETPAVCREFAVDYIRIERAPEYRNPSIARNAAYRRASGDVLICQSDDVLHFSPNCIKQLAESCAPQGMSIASVYNYRVNRRSIDPGGFMDVYSGPSKPYPLFFLGSVRREHVYAIGGNDEEFTLPGYEDNFFSECLMRGRNLTPHYFAEIIGVHQHHHRPFLRDSYRAMKEVFDRKMAEGERSGRWVASGGPWKF